MPEVSWGWRQSNIGALLFAASDRFLREKLAAVHAAGFPEMGDAQLALLLAIDSTGTRPTQIAARTGLTKPSVSELLDRATRGDLVARQNDPADTRARIVKLTPLGRRALAAIHDAIAEAEMRFSEITGTSFTPAFKQVLGHYAAGRKGDDAARDFGWYQGNVGRVLALAARRFVGDVLAMVHDHGHRDIGEALLSMVRRLDLAGTRLTDLAARARITKQSMRELVDRGEALSIVVRAPDPGDRRAKLVAFTPAGLAMLADMRLGVDAAESRLAGAVGSEFLKRLREALQTYCAAPDRR